MKTKNLAIAAIVLVVLAGVVILSEQLGNKKPSEESLKIFPALTLGTCSKIVVFSGADTVTLRHKSGAWTVDLPGTAGAAGDSTATGINPLTPAGAVAAVQYPADSALMAIAFEKLAGWKRDILISQNTAKQTLFEVDAG
ncbi:MAG: hypothetical protein PHC61_11470, partial [Chitinivibrionales bacterium]|nr:hypothetical protein [Chitinivibrionales bacterium]